MAAEAAPAALGPADAADAAPSGYKEAQRFQQTQAGSCCALGLKAQLEEASRGRGQEGGGRQHYVYRNGPLGEGPDGPINNNKKLSPGWVSWAHQLGLPLPAPGAS